MSQEPTLSKQPKSPELLLIPQELIDALYMSYISRIEDLDSTDRDKDEKELALISNLCTKKGLPTDHIADYGRQIILYTTPKRKRNEENAIELCLEIIDENQTTGEFSYRFKGVQVQRFDERGQDHFVHGHALWDERIKLKASPAALERMEYLKQEDKATKDEEKRHKQERQAREDEEERKDKELYNKYSIPALDFIRLHVGKLLSINTLGTLEPLLTDYWGWKFEPGDKINIHDTARQLEVEHVRGESTLDVIAFDKE